MLIVMDKRIAPVLLLLASCSRRRSAAATLRRPAPGLYDPYSSGIGPMVRGSRRLDDQ
jgi:hypothetical protein